MWTLKLEEETMKRRLWILLTLSLCCLPGGGPASAKGGITCDEGTMVYSFDHEAWVCSAEVFGGWACTLCSEVIDVTP